MARPSRLLAVDDLDLKLSDTERAAARGLLRSVAAGGTTAVAARRGQVCTLGRLRPELRL
ncbi:hypothetical protein [Streptomyces sp. NPDC058595]|uniref:hypothetical protein n=1 Tax=Streptomyces sp. NPDC058595 TaxID=3346550 RepID=UPI003666A046